MPAAGDGGRMAPPRCFARLSHRHAPRAPAGIADHLRGAARARAKVCGVKQTYRPVEEVPELALVRVALDRARAIECDENDFAVGVCDPHGRVIAGTMLDCYRQVSKFSREMRKLGYAPVIVDDERRMQGCDVVYVRPFLH